MRVLTQPVSKDAQGSGRSERSQRFQAPRCTRSKGMHASWVFIGATAESCRNTVSASLTALILSTRADDAGVEAIELLEHPFFMAALFQPQIGSADGRPLRPVLKSFVAAV